MEITRVCFSSGMQKPSREENEDAGKKKNQLLEQGPREIGKKTSEIKNGGYGPQLLKT